MSDLNTLHSQSREDVDQREYTQLPSTANLLERALEPMNLQRAWRRVRRNKGVPGIDGLSIEAFPQYFRDNGQAIITAVRSGDYQPYPVKRVSIPKEGGGERALGIPTVFDRLIQQAIVLVLSPLIDPTFSAYSYGFRPGRSQHDAIKHVRATIDTGRKIAVDVDLSQFFDRVNHDRLMTQLGRMTRDKALLKLIGRYLRAGIVDNGVLLVNKEGVPQGGPLSPLLSNVVLDPLDKELENRQLPFARYADDFIILVASRRAGQRVMDSVTRFVEQQLKLKVNNHKSQVVPVSKSKFLGFSFRGKWLVWHPKTIVKFKHKVRELTSRSWGVSMTKRLKQLRLFLQGWMNYYGIANQYQQCVSLDHWIRRRIRMCFWKHWRRVRTRVGNLLKLGVALDLAVTCGSSNKSYWRCSKTEGINAGLGNAFLKQIGLISLRDLWIAIHYR